MVDCIVDTNVISDVMTKDERWYDWSIDELTQSDRRLIVNPIIYAELCCKAESFEETDLYLDVLQLRYVEMTRPALHLAAQAFVLYRKRGGNETSPLPDFFIGVHAVASNLTILTRDQGRYKSYFPQVSLISH